MRRADREIKDRAEIDGILATAEVIHLGLFDGTEPYVVPMTFGYADGCIYLHGALEGRKVDILKAHPRVCFETYTDYEIVRGPVACSFSTKYRSVIGYGVASFVTDRQAKVNALDCMMSKFAPGPYHYNEEALVRTNIIRIEIESMTGKKLGY